MADAPLRLERRNEACSHPRTKFLEGTQTRVCADCGEVSADQRSPVQIAQEAAAKAGADSLVGLLFQEVADKLAKPRKETR